MCKRFGTKGFKEDWKIKLVGCLNSGTGVVKAYNENTCRYENYCDCEKNRNGGKSEGKHGEMRCCELKKACRKESCKEGEICRENVYRKGFWCDKGCYNEKGGHDYRGKVDVTENGRVCKHWNEKPKKSAGFNPNDPRYKKYNLRENYCRNPTWDKKKNPGKRPWCYTDDIGAETYWEYCDIPACKTSAEAKNHQRHQAWMERRGKSKIILRERTEKTGFSDWLKSLKNV